MLLTIVDMMASTGKLTQFAGNACKKTEPVYNNE